MLKTCVIGLGHIGNIHSRIYSEYEGSKLLAVCDILHHRAEAAGKRFNVPYYLDAAEMLKDMKPDIVSVTTGGYEYSSDHCHPTVQSLNAGCHVLCEKPISNDLAHAQSMVDLGKKLGLCFGINLNHRFTPAGRQAKKWQEDGRIGDLLFANMALWIGRFKDEDSEYYHLKALNPHSMDILRYFCGDVKEVQCYAMKAPGRSMWSTASVNMKFANGAVGHLTSSYDIERGHPMERCEVAGTKGRFVWEDMWREATLFERDNPVRESYVNPVFGGFESFYDTFKDRVIAFVDQVALGVKPEDIDGSGVQGLEATRVIHAAIKSLKEDNRPVRVAEVTE